jgi:hypothetical protein
MVLWYFKLHPKTGDYGTGQLNAPPATGLLAGGQISLDYDPIIEVHSGAVWPNLTTQPQPISIF